VVEELLREAERTGMWLWSQYQDLWFSPAELRKAQLEGKFRWGPENWKLRDPREQAEALEREAQAARDRADRFARTIRIYYS
jgi:hypothetical protein